MSKKGDGKDDVRRRKRATSIVPGVTADRRAKPRDDDAASGNPGLSRAERRRLRLQASERERELSDRQRSLLGIDTGSTEAIPETAPPPAPTRPPAWQRHDALVAACAIALFVGGVLLHHRLTAPALERFERLGLSLARPSGWPPPTAVPAPPLRLAADAPADDASAAAAPYHVLFTSPLDPTIALEVRVQSRGDHDHPRVAMALARAARYGESYFADEGDNQTLGGRDWVRTRFRYAARPNRSGPPTVRTAIEYAAVVGERLYLVTFHGAGAAAAHLEEAIAPSLAIASPEAPR